MGGSKLSRLSMGGSKLLGQFLTLPLRVLKAVPRAPLAIEELGLPPAAGLEGLHMEHESMSTQSRDKGKEVKNNDPSASYLAS